MCSCVAAAVFSEQLVRGRAKLLELALDQVASHLIIELHRYVDVLVSFDQKDRARVGCHVLQERRDVARDHVALCGRVRLQRRVPRSSGRSEHSRWSVAAALSAPAPAGPAGIVFLLRQRRRLVDCRHAGPLARWCSRRKAAAYPRPPLIDSAPVMTATDHPARLSAVSGSNRLRFVGLSAAAVA